MSNGQNAERIVENLGKDFKLVGKSHVHAWYAWAIVGIVLGMALMVVYVANRSIRFDAGKASTNDLEPALPFAQLPPEPNFPEMPAVMPVPPEDPGIPEAGASLSKIHDVIDNYASVDTSQVTISQAMPGQMNGVNTLSFVQLANYSAMTNADRSILGDRLVSMLDTLREPLELKFINLDGTEKRALIYADSPNNFVYQAFLPLPYEAATLAGDFGKCFCSSPASYDYKIKCTKKDKADTYIKVEEGDGSASGSASLEEVSTAAGGTVLKAVGAEDQKIATTCSLKTNAPSNQCDAGCAATVVVDTQTINRASSETGKTCTAEPVAGSARAGSSYCQAVNSVQ